MLEKIDTCRTAIFDKTGTLTYGQPKLTEVIPAAGLRGSRGARAGRQPGALLEAPAGASVLDRGRGSGGAALAGGQPRSASGPGEGLRGNGRRPDDPGHQPQEAGRRSSPSWRSELPPRAGGLECVVLIDDRYAATFRFRDQPRAEGASFIHHLGPKHHFDRVMLVSGDRESEVRYLAEQVGIDEVFAGQTPEQKLELVREETQAREHRLPGRRHQRRPGADGRDGRHRLRPEQRHHRRGRRRRDHGQLAPEGRRVPAHQPPHATIALQSAVGGMALSVVGMLLAAAGHLPPVAGAIVQEVIDVVAVLNALRVAIPPRALSDY